MTTDSTQSWSSDEYAARVAELEAEGLTTSDAQGIADMEMRAELAAELAAERKGDRLN